MGADHDRLDALRRLAKDRAATPAEKTTARRLAKALAAKIGKRPRRSRRKGHGAALPEPPAARSRRRWIVWLEAAPWRARVELLPQMRIVRCGHALDGTAGAAAGRRKMKKPAPAGVGQRRGAPGMMFSTMSGQQGRPTRSPSRWLSLACWPPTVW
jgi:hypothetical protein